MTSDGVVIAAETPLQDDVRAMVAALNATMRPLTPPEFQFQLTAEQMAEPSVVVLVARDGNGRAVGMGALKDHGGGLGEVKRMFTLPEMRGARIGSLLVAHIEAEARGLGMTRLVLETGEDEARHAEATRLVLETGEAPGFEEAWRVYERNGFRQCAAVLNYPDSGFSRFYDKKLDP